MTAHYLDHWLDEHVDDPAAWSPAPPGAGRLLPPTPPAPADAAYPLPPRTPPLAPWRALEGTAYLVLVEGESGTPQYRGSELTYARRYTLEGLTGVAATVDDDGAGASEQKGRRKAETPDQRQARQDEHHPSWAKSGPGFHAELARMGMTYDRVADLCESRGNPRPTALDVTDLRDLLRWLRGDGRAVYLAAYPAEGGSAEGAGVAT
jgi:hypothetical protein